MKRFYKFVVLKKKSNSSFQVILDDRPIQTPKRKIINLPNRKLANALAREWKNQKQDILLEKMPITQLLFMAYDYISVKKIRFITEILKMYETDLVFYWAEDSDELLKRQQKTWLPLMLRRLRSPSVAFCVSSASHKKKYKTILKKTMLRTSRSMISF